MAIIKVGKEEVDLNEQVLEFNQDNINDFLTKYASLHRYYQNKHNDAVYIAKTLNDKYSHLYNAKFRDYKTNGNLSDKMAEASAKSDDEVVALLDRVRMAEYVKDELQGFLRSMDYAHSNAKEFCYNMRKELDKIYPRHVASESVQSNSGNAEMYEKLKDIYG